MYFALTGAVSDGCFPVRAKAFHMSRSVDRDSRAMYIRDMNPEDIMRRLEMLRQEHRDLDSAIMALAEAGSGDQLQLARLQKRKLRLKDEIAALEDALVPDIIA